MRKATITLLLTCVAVFAQQKGSFTDARDKKTYKTIKIGEQTWMAENLNYDAKGSKCYGEGGEVIFFVNEIFTKKTLSSKEIQDNCEKYGRLYDWNTAMAISPSCNSGSSGTCSSQINAKHKGICPSGWHIPNNGDWDVLLRYVDSQNGGKDSGKHLRAANGWNDLRGIAGNSINGNGTDTYGFSALPGGNGYSDDLFVGVGSAGNWWSASESEHDSYTACGRHMSNEVASTSWSYPSKYYLYSVRCVKD